MELYQKYRPQTLAGIVGQEGAVTSIEKLLERDSMPHALLLTGPSGTGKTTIARIIKRLMKCEDADYQEIDCAAVDSPLDTVRVMRRNMRMVPLGGKVRIFFLEEAQSWSRAGFTQQALLKVIEDCPSHAYFMIATTDAGKLHKAIHTRCSEIRLQSLSCSQIMKLLSQVVRKEGMDVSNAVSSEIAVAADGSARKALVILEQVGFLSGEDDQLQAVQRNVGDKDSGIMLARALLYRQPWPEVAKILKDLTDEPESVRYLILGYCRTVLLGGGKFASRAFMIIDVFGRNFYDSKQAGLAAACWEVIVGVK